MKTLIALFALASATAFAQPVPISPIGQVYTVSTPILLTNNGFSPCGANLVTTPVTFQWQDTGAQHYELKAWSGCNGNRAADTVDMDVYASSCSNGVCSATPNPQFALAINAMWQVQVYNTGVWSAPTLFSINYPGQNASSATGCQWNYSTDGAGVGRRIVDMSSTRGSDIGIFPKSTWTRISVADLVPAGAQAIQTKIQLIQGVVSGEPIIGVKTRRHGSTVDPEPYGGFMYSTAARHTYDDVVMLGTNLDFDFWWSDAANGNSSCQSLGTCSTNSQAVTLMVTGFCK